MLVDNLPRESAFRRAQLGERVDWKVAEYMLANIYDVLAGANWQRSADGYKGVRRPKRIYRPGDVPETALTQRGPRLTKEETRAVLARVRERR